MSVFRLLILVLPLLAGCLKMQPGEVVYAGNTLGKRLQIDMHWDNSCYVNDGALWCVGDYYGIGVETNFRHNGTPVRVIAAGVSAVRLGYSFGCAQVDGDDLYCWGDNGDGQLGIGSYDDVPTPVLVINGGVQSFDVGDTHVCAVVSGALKCWGRNNSYQIGDGLTADVLSPKTIIASGVSHAFAGGRTSCATVSGVLKCWGENSDNEVGTGTGTDVLTPTTVLNMAVSEMSIGSNNSCGRAGGSVYCWGDYFASNTPALFLSGATQLTGGDEFVCAIASGDLKCWGWHRYYLVDENDPYEDAAWQQVTTIAADVDYHAAGGGGLCYVRGNKVYCGGEDYAGTLFRGSSGDYVLDFVKVFDQPFTKLKALGPATCGSTALGEMYCTGGGVGSRYFGFVQPVEYPTFTSVVSGVSDFGLYASLGCYVRSGALECAGIHTVWTLGDGATTTSTAPITIVASGVTDVAIGQSNQCYIEGGALNCWGEGGNGLLGQGDTVDRTTPVEIISSGVTKVSMSGTVICAVASGDLYCWGRNSSGQLGLGTSTTMENTPQLVLTGGVTSVDVAANHACALQSGAVKCWGSNFYGAVGLPATTATQTTPATIISSGATQLTESMGWGQASCAIVAGELYCWGKESFHVGGEFTPRLVETVGVPVLVTQSGPVLCYHNSAGETYCRGNNSYDRVGFAHQERFTLGLWSVSL